MKKNNLQYICNNCGANIEPNTNNRIINCIYCGSSIMLMENGIENLNITKIIPFNISENEIKDKAYKEYDILKYENIVKINQMFIPYYSGSFKYQSEIIYNNPNDCKTIASTKYEIEDRVEKTFFAPTHYDKFLSEAYEFFNIKYALNFDPTLVSSNQKIDTKNKFKFEQTAKEKVIYKINNNKLYFGLPDEQDVGLEIVTHIEQLKISQEAILIPFYEIILENNTRIYIIGDSNQKRKKINKNKGKRKANFLLLLCALLFLNISILNIIFSSFNTNLEHEKIKFDFYLNINILVSIILVIVIFFVKKIYPFKRFKKIKIANNYYFYDKEV